MWPLNILSLVRAALLPTPGNSLAQLLLQVNRRKTVGLSGITFPPKATIPKAVRNHLGLKPGDRVKFFVHLDDSVALLPL
jgi:AbrB family looped-hinge helix DNA binding protein